MDKIIIQNFNIYKEDINSILKQNCSWEKLKNKTILISGGTGLIGTYLVDMFLLLNDTFKLNLHLLVISRKTLCNNSEVIKFFQHRQYDSIIIKHKHLLNYHCIYFPLISISFQ